MQLSSDERISCIRDNMGSWRIHSSNLSSLQAACTARCAKCDRCQYVAFSQAARLCAWYAECDTGDLRHWWSHRLGRVPWFTLKLREQVPAPVAVWDTSNLTTPLRLAIATLSFGGQVCPLHLWCQAARKLKWALSGPWDVRMVIIGTQHKGQPHSKVTSCPEAEFVAADVTLLDTATRCLQHGNRHGFNTGAPPEMMIKWQTMARMHGIEWCTALPFPPALNAVLTARQGMTQYDAVFFADLDTDMFPFETDPAGLRRRWQLMLPLFLRPRREQLVSADECVGAVGRGALTVHVFRCRSMGVARYARGCDFWLRAMGRRQ
ncbi:MAG: hypothetical protein SGPRY_009383 [Prymnesium sp.]